MKLQKYNFPDTGTFSSELFIFSKHFSMVSKIDANHFSILRLFSWNTFLHITSKHFFHLNSYMESMVGSSSWNWWPWWWWISKHALCWSGTCIDTGDPFARYRFRSEPNSPGKYVTAYYFLLVFFFSFPFVNAATKALTITLASWLHSHGLSSLLLYYLHFFFPNFVLFLFRVWMFCLFYFFFTFVRFVFLCGKLLLKFKKSARKFNKT